jgi:hypothetical protein
LTVGRHPALPPPVAWPWMLGAAAIWLVSVVAGSPVQQPPPPGLFYGEVTLVSEVGQGRYGPWALASVGRTIVLADVGPPAGRGDRLVVRGVLTGKPGEIGGRRYSAILRVGELEARRPSAFLPHVWGRAIRERILTRLEPITPGRGLLAGFLASWRCRDRTWLCFWPFSI